MDRVTVPEAAERLGISQDAVRQRIRRGSIQHEKDENGRVYVYVDATHTHHDSVQSDSQNPTTDPMVNALLASQQDQITFLRKELERKDAIIMSLTQRIPELEPAATSDSFSDASDSPLITSKEESKGQVPPDAENAKSEPWWRRIFR
jgi:excisionase family DNA binding protein